MTTFVADPTCTNVYSSDNYDGSFLFNNNNIIAACTACGTDNPPPTITNTFLQNGYSPVNEYLQENNGNTGSSDCSCSNTNGCDVLPNMGFQAYGGQLYVSNSPGINSDSGLTDHSTAKGACCAPLSYPSMYNELGFKGQSCSDGSSVGTTGGVQLPQYCSTYVEQASSVGVSQTAANAALNPEANYVINATGSNVYGSDSIREGFEFPHTSYSYIIIIIALVLVLAVFGFFIYKEMNAPKIPLKMSGRKKRF